MLWCICEQKGKFFLDWVSQIYAIRFITFNVVVTSVYACLLSFFFHFFRENNQMAQKYIYVVITKKWLPTKVSATIKLCRSICFSNSLKNGSSNDKIKSSEVIHQLHQYYAHHPVSTLNGQIEQNRRWEDQTFHFHRVILSWGSIRKYPQSFLVWICGTLGDTKTIKFYPNSNYRFRCYN